MPRRLTGVKDHLKSWPLIGRANFISTNGLSFALGSQPLYATLVNLKNWKVKVVQGLAAQSKAEAIGQNKISSANQRPGYQMIFFFFLVRFDLLL